MTVNNKKLSIFVLAGIVALSSVATTIMLDQQQEQVTTTENEIVHSEPRVNPNDPQVYDEEHARGGVTILQATPMGFEQPRPQHDYNKVSMKDMEPYLKRAITNGATVVSLSELESYFVNYKEVKGTDFEILNEDGTTSYMRILFKEPKLDLDNHYVKAFVFSNEYIIEDAKTLAPSDNAKFERFMEEKNSWQVISPSQASDIKNILEDNGKTLTINGQHAQIMYIGGLSEELQIPEIREMYSLGNDRNE